MRIISPSFEIIGNVNPVEILKNLESYGRTCYKSEGKITENSADSFLRRVLKSGHESVIEHEKIAMVNFSFTFVLLASYYRKSILSLKCNITNSISMLYKQQPRLGIPSRGCRLSIKNLC